MTARSVIVKVAAKADIREIVRYIAEDSPGSAERFGFAFGEAIDRIQSFPESGPRIDGFHDLRFVRVSARFWRYLIVYRIDGPEIRVIRVLQGARDIRGSLSKSDLS